MRGKEDAGRKGLTRHRKVCATKRRFATEFKAIDAMHNLERQQRFDGQPLRVYECTECDGWHIGHETPKAERR